MARLVVFDMDGVLADIDSSWVFVHKRFGVNNDHSLYAYLRGEIDDLEFIRRDIQLWREKDPGVTVRKIREILADVPLMSGVKETADELRRKGVKTAIVSAGIDLLAERIAGECGMDSQLANGFVVDSRGRLSGEGVLRVRLMEKGEAVAQLATGLGARDADVLSVGNSSYDVPMFQESGYGIAFNPMDERVREEADAVVEGKDLRAILKYV